jgi:hypothetical protein
MAPSQKRKRKSLPKRPCPCCGAVLSEKTIDRHVSGTHLPTCIKVTHASAAQKRAKFSGNLSNDFLGDLSGDSSGNDLGDSDLDSEPDFTETGSDPVGVELVPALHSPRINEHTVDPTWFENDENDAESKELREILETTWSGCRSRVDEYAESDAEDEDFEEDEDSDPDPDPDFEWEEAGKRNGLGMDELIDEDLQRIIAEFGA